MQQDIELLKYLARYDKEIERIYSQLIKELAKIGASINDVDSDKLFSFDNYPQVKDKVDKLLNQYAKILKDRIIIGMKDAINMSYTANTLVLQELSSLSDKAISEQREIAKNNFIQSRVKPKEGLSLSQKVWNYTRQSKAEFEAAMSEIIEDGLLKGISAEKLGRRVRNKLNNPEMVYRRYHLKKQTLTGKKDVIEWRRKIIAPDGTIRYIKEDLEKVGQGVYRSSRKNALRLAATEINMAYRYADCVRWASEPFVLGIHIRLSENHTCNGKPFVDMCDDLQGDYPKWFMWKGWHPRCRCSASPILCPKEEMLKISKLPEEEYRSYKPKGLITDVPDNFKQWVVDNQKRIGRAAERGTLPYFIKDNQNIASVKYSLYDDKWEKVKFYGSNGYVVVDKSRIEHSKISKNESAKFDKELSMCKVFAKNGYQIEMLGEISRISSPDVNINGVAADLKRVSSANNIVKYAKKAVQRQGASKVLFQFDVENSQIHSELLKVKNLGIHAMYFFTDRENDIFIL